MKPELFIVVRAKLALKSIKVGLALKNGLSLP
jgi:hypothetical protein